METGDVKVRVFDDLYARRDVVKRIELDLRPVVEMNDPWLVKLGDNARLGWLAFRGCVQSLDIIKLVVVEAELCRWGCSGLSLLG